jgi:hypothetical protein
MHPQLSKTLALLGGVATLALGTSYVLRTSVPKPRALQGPCLPRLLELERAVCQPLAAAPTREQLSELSLHAPH